MPNSDLPSAAANAPNTRYLTEWLGKTCLYCLTAATNDEVLDEPS